MVNDLIFDKDIILIRISLHFQSYLISRTNNPWTWLLFFCLKPTIVAHSNTLVLLPRTWIGQGSHFYLQARIPPTAR
jgi:hypothetical protein